MVELTLKWEKFGLCQGLHSMMVSQELVDVTIMCQGQFFQAHKSVLAACSQQFRQIFKAAPDKNPIIVLKGVSVSHIKNILHFMYLGEVTVAQDELADFFATADELGISALSSKSKEKGATQRPLPDPPELTPATDVQPVRRPSSQLRLNSKQIASSPVASPVAASPVDNPQPSEIIQENEPTLDMDCDEMIGHVIKEEVDNDVVADEWNADPEDDTDTNTSIPHHTVHQPIEDCYMLEAKGIPMIDPDDPGPSTSQGGGPWLEDVPSVSLRTSSRRSKPPQPPSSTEQDDPLQSDPSSSQGSHSSWNALTQAAIPLKITPCEVSASYIDSYNCSCCSLSFSSREDRTQHTKDSHKSNAETTCDICLKLCKSTNALRTHRVRYHTGPQVGLRHTCDFCGSTFSLKTHLRRHERNTHGIFIKHQQCQL